MQIDNVSSEDGRIHVTRAHGFTLHHAPDCRFVTGPWDDWRTACDCFISRVTTAELPDGTITIIPEGYSAGNEAHINWLRGEVVRMSRSRYDAERWKWLALSVVASVATMVFYFLGKSFIEGWW